MEARYVPGTGLLLAASGRWLLVGPSVADDPDLVDRLWSLLSSTGRNPDASTLVRSALGGADHVLLDTTSGVPVVHAAGPARAVVTAAGHTLRLDPDLTAPGSLPLVGGAVRADAVDVPAPGPTRAPAPGQAPGVLIDGIPEHVLASTGRTPTSPPARGSTAPGATLDPADPAGGRTVRRTPASPSATTGSGTTDHDGRTSYRPADLPAGPPPPPPGPPPGAHLEQRTHETVLAARCPRGHVTAAFTPTCRVCGTAVAPQEPQRLPRPVLGHVRLPEGETVPLDRGVVLGRRPAAPEASTDWPHLVTLPQDSPFVSRTHLRLELDGWLVLATDLGSRGGTTLRAPGRPPERIRPGEPYVWEPGQVLDLADSYEIVYEVTG